MSILTLYKYKSLSTPKDLKHAESLICDNEIYFSSPFDFNDPFECRPVFSMEATEEKIKKYIKERLGVEQLTPEIMARAKETSFQTPLRDAILKLPEDERVGLCCFSEIADEVLMYSHYSSAHQGFCLEFDATDETPFFGEAQKVTYTELYPVINPVIYSNEENMERMFLFKSSKWGYEKECRMIAPHTANTVRKFPEELLKGVIFGCRMREKHKIRFREWARKRNSPLQFYEARIKEEEYGLDIEPVD